MLSTTLEQGLRAYGIGDKLRTLRLSKKMGLVELGRHTGLSAALLSKVERGKLFPTLPTLLRSLWSSASGSSSSSAATASATPSPSCAAGTPAVSREARRKGRLLLLRVARLRRSRAPPERVLRRIRARSRREGAPAPARRGGVSVRPQGAARAARRGRGPPPRRRGFRLLPLDPASQLPADRQQAVLGSRRVGSMTAPRILLTGATGYVGGRLLAALELRGVPVRCFARRPEALRGRAAPSTEIAAGDALDAPAVARALEGIEAGYYLIHSMGGEDFASRDREAARIFGEAARAAGVRRIIYLGGLGAGAGGLSEHLRSRQETGEILRQSGVPVVELRASIVLGSGSLSFEMIRALVERLPVMICPRWVRGRGPADRRRGRGCLPGRGARSAAGSERIYEIGGPDRVTYGDLMREYARQRGLKRLLIPVPLLTPRLSSLWLGLVTPLYARVGRKLVDSLRNPTVIRDPAALEAFPVRPRSVREAIARALVNEDEAFARTRWSDAVSSAGADGALRRGSRRHSPYRQPQDLRSGAARRRPLRRSAASAATRAGTTATRSGACAGRWTCSSEGSACAERAARRRAPPGRRARLLAGRVLRTRSPAQAARRDESPGPRVAGVRSQARRRGHGDPPDRDLRRLGARRTRLLVRALSPPPLHLRRNVARHCDLRSGLNVPAPDSWPSGDRESCRRRLRRPAHWPGTESTREDSSMPRPACTRLDRRI